MRNLYPKGVIQFNGKSSADLGIIVSKYPIMRKPARKGTVRTIPGRSGAIVSDTRAYETYVQPYEISVINKEQGIAVAARAVADWLLGSSGYCRLEDDFEPDIYRMARYASQLDIETIMTMHGTAVIEFECQPQRYLKTGEQEIEITAEQSTVYNPTNQNAFPLIKVTKTVTPGESGGEQVEPVPVELTWISNSYIAGATWPADQVHRVRGGIFGSIRVSQQIDVSDYEAAIITAKAHDINYYNAGVRYATCYTLLNSSGKPLSSVKDAYVMVDERIPIPKSAKYLVICDLNDPNWAPTPAVTLIPKPTYVEGETNSITINGKTATIAFSDRSTVYLDCDAHDAFFADGSNANNIVTFSEDGNLYPTFPYFSPGDNAMYLEGENLTATLIPRWWDL